MARPLRSVKSGPLAQRRIQLVGLPFAIGRAADALLKSAGFGEPMPPKNGGDANAEGAAQPHKPTPPSPCSGVAALYEAMQQGVADAGAATRRAEAMHSNLSAQWDVALKVLATPLSPAVAESSNPAASSSSETPSGCCEGCSQAALATGQPVALPSEQLDRVVVSTRTTPGAAS